jgi:hypothetical protein
MQQQYFDNSRMFINVHRTCGHEVLCQFPDRVHGYGKRELANCNWAFPCTGIAKKKSQQAGSARLSHLSALLRTAKPNSFKITVRQQCTHSPEMLPCDIERGTSPAHSAHWHVQLNLPHWRNGSWTHTAVEGCQVTPGEYLRDPIAEDVYEPN